MRRALLLAAMVVASSGCFRSTNGVDAGATSSPDASDAHTEEPDAGAGQVDGGQGPMDAGHPDTGLPDANHPDAASADAAVHDSGTVDAATHDSGTVSVPHDAGDITTFRVFSTSSAPQTSIPVTLGHVFLEGDAPGPLSARLSNGTSVPVQVDRKATHSDGSLRHALLSVILPDLAAGAMETITLARASDPSPGPSVSLSDLLATDFDTTVRITQGGRTYSASARDLLTRAVNPPTWMEGPVATEWHVGGPVSDTSGAHPHLAAYFHVRYFATVNAVRVDVIIENGWSYVPDASDQTYDVRVMVGSAVDYTQAALVHYDHARWHHVSWWGQPAPAINPQQDRAYLTSTKAVPRYLELTPTSTQLDGFTLTSVPMENGNLEDYMPSGGPSSSIGPLPAWATAWVLSQDDRARRATLANADSGGAYSIHYRNDQPGDPSSGLPISIGDHPEAGTNGDFPPSSTSTPYTADTAHQPSVAYLAYLITGDAFYLEEMQFWVHWNWLNGNEISVRCRDHGTGLVNCHQERGQAWALRELGRTAWITPDEHPLKASYVQALDANRQWYEATYLPGGASHNVFGAIDRGLLGTESGRQETKTWMDDFFTWSVGHLMELGYMEWRPMLEFKAEFVRGRLTTSDFCYIMAGTDTIALAAGAMDPWRTTWSSVYQASFPTQLTSTTCGSQAMADVLSSLNGAHYQAGEIFNYANLAGSRVAIMHAATSVLVDQGIPDGQAAWTRVRSSTVLPDWSEYQNFALQPR